MERADNSTLVLSWNEEVERSRESFTSGNSSGTADALDLQRDISLEFIEDANEQKFERLVKEDKLKTVFKRRHSQALSSESRSNSPINYTSAEDRDQTRSANANLDGKLSKYGNSKNHGNKDSNSSEKRMRQNSRTSSSSSLGSIEMDPAILARRQKQIDYGKNTIAYERYTEMIPKNQRTADQPRTPNKYGKYSRRAFDGLIKIWRKRLHEYDPPAPEKNGNCDGDDSSTDSDSD